MGQGRYLFPLAPCSPPAAGLPLRPVGVLARFTRVRPRGPTGSPGESHRRVCGSSIAEYDKPPLLPFGVLSPTDPGDGRDQMQGIANILRHIQGGRGSRVSRFPVRACTALCAPDPKYPWSTHILHYRPSHLDVYLTRGIIWLA